MVVFVFKGVDIFYKVITQFNNLSVEFLFFIVEFIKLNIDLICFTIIMRINSFVLFVRDI